MNTAPDMLRVTSESLAGGRCANCFQPIFRIPNSIIYRHRHNNSDSCTKKLDETLIVRDIAVHSGDSWEISLVKVKMSLHKLIMAHNRVVEMVLEMQKPNQTAVVDPNKRDFIGQKPKSKVETKSFADITGTYAEKPVKPSFTVSDSIALLKQFRYICRCVAPIPVLVTGPGKIQFCESCHRVIIEEEND